MPHTSLLCSDSLVLNHCKDTTQIQNAKQKTNIYLSYLRFYMRNKWQTKNLVLLL